MSDATMATTTTRRARLALSRLLAIAVLIGGASACESDPAGVDGHDEGDIASFRIDQQIQTPGGEILETLYTYDGPINPDTLDLADDETIEFEIVWLDEDGDELDVHEDEHTWSIETVTGVTFAHGSEAWEGTFTTVDLLPGNQLYSAFRVTLRHAGEVEFQTPYIPVRIES